MNLTFKHCSKLNIKKSPVAIAILNFEKEKRKKKKTQY